MVKKPKVRSSRPSSHKDLPSRSSDGKYCVLIVTSSRILRWPYRAVDDPPRYKTKKEAEKILKAYLSFSNNNSRATIKRVIEEFEIVELNEETKELIL
jgi:hypothetical protein